MAKYSNARSDELELALDQVLHPFDQAMYECAMSGAGGQGASAKVADSHFMLGCAWMHLCFPFIICFDWCTKDTGGTVASCSEARAGLSFRCRALVAQVRMENADPKTPLVETARRRPPGTDLDLISEH